MVWQIIKPYTNVTISILSRKQKIGEAKRTIANLQYRNGKIIPFENFIDKIQRVVDDLEPGERPLYNDDIVYSI